MHPFVGLKGRLSLIMTAMILVAAMGLREQQESTVAIVEVFPSNHAFGVAPNAHLQITFPNEMNPATLTPATVQILDTRGNVVPARVSYNSYSKICTVDSLSPLAYGAKYQLQVAGGNRRIRDASGNILEDTFTSSFTTAASPLSGPGGPILVVTSGGNSFSRYYPEILRAEGLQEFAVEDAATISNASLSKYQVVLLPDIPFTSEQILILTHWVENGGKLIAMHPDPKLAELLGVSDAESVEDEGYIAVDSSAAFGQGIVNVPIQFHGRAECFKLHGATEVARLYRDANTPTDNPAVTIRDVGTHGGMAAAFLFDLAKSVVYTRQGNPAWAGQRRTGSVWGDWTLSTDLFCGSARFDPQKDWIDPNNIEIPQADEQQRLLANLIGRMNLKSLPLPRFAYFPNGAPAVVILTGDDHDSGGTPGRFARVKSAGISGGLPVNSTSYIYPGPANTDAVLARFIPQNFETALHFEVTSGVLFGNSSDMPSDWNSFSELENLYAWETFVFNQTYPSLPTPRTSRVHGPVWSDYDSLPRAEFDHGVRLDTSYYYAPPQFVKDRPGYFTGSGIPMRFATAAGTPIDVFQATTQITDESGQTEPRTIDTLLDNAIGPKEYYGAIAVNAHDDDAVNPLADAVIQAAKEHDVPIISAEILLDFEDGRDNSSFSDLLWNPSTGRLTFSINLGARAAHLQTMVPLINAADGTVSTIRINGKEITLQTRSANGISYAVFDAENGSAIVQYTNTPSLQK